ncbi:MAG: hypothetical protein K2Y05_04165 [Hyphomicrobiaceae bacterium]|nr:hypothetical protein [Hyphomicrobiaceae bacterium]
MASLLPKPETPEEKIVLWLILLTWPLWVTGALYHAFSIAPWVLAGLAFARRLGLLDDDPQLIAPLPLTVWLWMFGMAMMAVALVLGHLNFDMGTIEIAKSLFGWAKGWALMAILPFAGATLKIRPQLMFRATNLLAAQTLIVTPVLMAGATVGLPPVLFTAPFYYIGGASAAFFEIGTHWIDPGSDDVRFRFFAPWGPAAAFVAQMMLVLGLCDRDWRWRIVVIICACVMCWLAKSRLSLVAIPVLLLALPIMSNLYRPAIIALGGVLTATAAFAYPLAKDLVEVASDRFQNARKDSSRVRRVLQNIAVHRWWTEAPLFGHGQVERGPHLVEFMPIGSHHTWNGLLFVKGATGWASLALPMAVSFAVLAVKAQRDRVALAAAGFLIVVFLNSMGENIEILAYLAWPGFLLLGMALKRRRIGVFAELLGSRR